ncbi:MAG TPA: primosomal protein N' [Gammaproteobacteria bacterium]|jgi:primosomal protein N' (replication factor Y)|nr:primosomal protein N' [Gammaproteobacteria bacterium]
MNIETVSLQVAVPRPLRQLYDYLPPIQGEWRHLQPGARVRISFGRREEIGIFIGFNENPTFARENLKPILEVIDNQTIFDPHVYQLCEKAAGYYQYPLGEVLHHALPKWLRQGKSLEKVKFSPIKKPPPLKKENFELNVSQKNAISAIQQAVNFQVFLLNGVTGSGKTEVYLQTIQKVIQEKKQVLILVPEIGLTPQTLNRFAERFTELSIVLHSGLTEKQRLHAWCLSHSGQAKIIIGTRSAIFLPFQNLGLIIIDEEHDLSFKQQEGFRYHARDLAILRAHMQKIPVILGSATPSLETLFKAEIGKFSPLFLPKRAGNAELPEFKVIDIRNQFLEEGVSNSLLVEIKTHLAASNQVMLFLNRRGFAPLMMCHACGWMVNCRRCDRRMTYHDFSKRLHCHHCDYQKSQPAQCESCGEKKLQTLGQGTERLEQVLQKYFPETSIVRIDRDTTKRKDAMETILQDIQTGKHQILIGTQMLAKGHHFPNVTLVGIIDADGGFFSSDFRALERMGQLVLQVAGRAGRVEKKGTVMIQTHHPEHPLLHQLFRESYDTFANTLLKERKLAGLPPYAFFALFRADAYQTEIALAFLQKIKEISLLNKKIFLLGPIPAPMPKRAGRYRAQLLIQAATRPELQNFLKKLLPEIEKITLKKKVRWSLDVDPLEMF